MERVCDCFYESTTCDAKMSKSSLASLSRRYYWLLMQEVRVRLIRLLFGQTRPKIGQSCSSETVHAAISKSGAGRLLKPPSVVSQSSYPLLLQSDVESPPANFVGRGVHRLTASLKEQANRTTQHLQLIQKHPTQCPPRDSRRHRLLHEVETPARRFAACLEHLGINGLQKPGFPSREGQAGGPSSRHSYVKLYLVHFALPGELSAKMFIPKHLPACATC